MTTTNLRIPCLANNVSEIHGFWSAFSKERKLDKNRENCLYFLEGRIGSARETSVQGGTLARAALDHMHLEGLTSSVNKTLVGL